MQQQSNRPEQHATSPSLTDPAGAEAFIRELYLNVLRQPSPPETQVEAWTRRAMNTGDPLAVFRAFIATPAVRSAVERDIDAATRWPPGHFYSPLYSRSELRRDAERVLAPRTLAGIDLNTEAQLELLGRLAPHFDTMPFDETARHGFRYRYDNRSYNFGDAAVYWAMLHVFRPRRILEVGSGFSSALALDAIDHSEIDCVCTFVDPYPELARSVTDPLPPGHRIVPARIQEVGLEEIARLGPGDLLFIDSSHVLKTGSDVHFELTEMLPRLPSGVLVHFHDVFSNMEYPENWIFDRAHGWNELYALHAFLLFNSAFTIVYFNHYIAQEHGAALKAQAPAAYGRLRSNPGGGLWLRRS